VVLASLLAFLTSGAKPVEAQQDATITVNPIKVDLGDVAVADTDTTTITLSNTGSDTVEIGAIEVDLSEGVDLGSLKLVDPQTGQEFVVDTATGVLQVLNPLLNVLEDTPITLEGTEQRVLELVFSPDNPGTINLVLKLLENTTNTVLAEVPVTGTAQRCTPSTTGTSGDDTIRDTNADEVICGLEGNDTIKATAGGKDTIIAGKGRDTVNFRDGVKRERANGGSGKDLCKVKDPKDKVKNCGTKKRR
jgi:Ca2+-binding RTX toxin-like protein